MAERRWVAYSLAIAVFAVDRLTKWIIETHVSFLDTMTVIPGFFDIVHSQNRGVAFGLLNDSTSAWRTFLLIGFSVAAVGFIFGLLWKSTRLDRRMMWGLGLVLGGAAGNVFDRIVWGRVTDFLEFYVGSLHWPTFNVADTAIVIGTGLLLLDLLKPKQEAART